MFAPMHKDNETLRFLCLDFGELQAEGYGEFVFAVSTNRTLKRVRSNYNGTSLQDHELTAAAALQGGVPEEIKISDNNLLPCRKAKNDPSYAGKDHGSHLRAL